MATPSESVRDELAQRRDRLAAIVARGVAEPQIESLLRDVDAALGRFSTGTYGFCETCGDPIESDRLAADPLIRVCIDHLSPFEARALEQDLDLASRVQRTLLPPPRVAARGWEMAYHYQPLGAVSGDYCDAVGSSDDTGELMFLLGDVSGKGVAASMLMAHLHASVRTLIGLGLPLPEVMTRANRVFCDSTMLNHYATLVCARFGGSGAVEICNAGHCPPLHVRRGAVDRLEATGVPIGMFCVRTYPASPVAVAPGEALVFYTDGVTEARNDAGEEYGEDRLTAVLASVAGHDVQAVVDACVRDLGTFRGRARRTDDETIMVVRRTA
jgi:phosphoserine phosphatase RsbU/P